MTKLKLFGSIHVDDPAKVEREFSTFADGVDAVFVEYPVDGVRTPRAYASMFLRAPLTALGLFLFTIVHLPLYAAFNRSPVPAEVLAARAVSAERGVPVVPVDDHYGGMVDRIGRVRSGFEWVLFVGTVALEPHGMALFVATLAGGFALHVAARRVHRVVWFVAAFAGPFAVGWALYGTFVLDRAPVPTLVALGIALLARLTVRTTVESRDEVMLRRVADRCAERNYETVALTAGLVHLPSLAERAESYGFRLTASYAANWRAEGTVHDGAYRQDRETTTGGDTGTEPDARAANTFSNLVGPRAFAVVVDWVVLVCVFGVTGGAALTGTAVLGAAFFDGNFPHQTLTVELTVLATYLLYWFGLEAAFGKTAGKKLLGLKVVRLDGGPPSVRDAFVRAVLRPVDFLPVCYVVALSTMYQTRRTQRVGDLLAGTRVALTDEPESS